MRELALLICAACGVAFMLSGLLAYLDAGDGQSWRESFVIGLAFLSMVAFDLMWSEYP